MYVRTYVRMSVCVCACVDIHVDMYAYICGNVKFVAIECDQYQTIMLYFKQCSPATVLPLVLRGPRSTTLRREPLWISGSWTCSRSLAEPVGRSTTARGRGLSSPPTTSWPTTSVWSPGSLRLRASSLPASQTTLTQRCGHRIFASLFFHHLLYSLVRVGVLVLPLNSALIVLLSFVYVCSIP